MKKKQFKITINASVEKVFADMLGTETYKKWTSVFNPTSNFEGTWGKNEKIIFLGTNKEGKKEGMIGIIREYEPNKYVSIEYTGLLDGDKEITSGKEVESWIGSHENYSYESNGDQTVVTVDLDVAEPFLEYFEETFPRALEKLKEVSES